MATTANNTLHKEIHPEQAKRVEAEERLHSAKEGKLPHNEDLEKGIDKVQKSINQDNERLSKTGQNVTKDINNILDTTHSIIREKNEGEELQKAYYHSHQGGANKQYSNRLAELKQIAMEDSSATRSEAKKNVSSLATIVKLAILSPEFRETINDMANITNQLLKKQSDKKDGKVKPIDDSSESSGSQVETKTRTETNIKEKAVRDDGQVEAAVIESNPVTEVKPKKTKEQKRDEREEKLIERLVDLAQTLHKNPEYRNSIDYMTNSASKLKKYSKGKNEQMKEKKAEDKSKENTESKEYHKQEARRNGKHFLERWIGDGFSLDRLIKQIVYLQDKSKSDEELRNLLKDWKKWSTSTIQDSDYVSNREKVRDDVKDLISRTRFMNSKYSDEVSIIRHEVNYINKSIQRDDSLLKLREDFSKLGRDIFMDSNGNPTIKPELMTDAQIIISSVLDSIRNIPLPPIKRYKDDMDVELENIVLNATDVTPSNIQFIAQADTDKDATSGSRQADNSFLVKISKVRAHLTSVNFYINKKTGFPKLEDRGLADIDLAGNGLSMTIKVTPNVRKEKTDVQSVFNVDTVNCTVDKLKIHLRETSHDALYKILSPIINMVAKKRIEAGISEYVKENLTKMNEITSQRATKAATKTDKKVQEKKQSN